MRYHFNPKWKEQHREMEAKFRKMRPTTYSQTWGGNQPSNKLHNRWPTLNQMQLHEARGKFPGSESKNKSEKCPMFF